ncbi:MAG: alkaline phosphatase family protein [Balneolaceae bacterium]|nr:alkaline phosphatase family protein [Balneolaceae bacterium]
MLCERSVFCKAQERGWKCHFINAYPEIFFQHSRQRGRWTCTTLMSRAAGLKLNGEEEVRLGKAVTAGLTQRAWREKLGLEVPVIMPEEAAERVLESMDQVDLLLYEYYLTDKAGHGRSRLQASEILERYGRFLRRLLKGVKSGHTLVLCSDHGNLEDLSVKTHTCNLVPLYVQGPGSRHFRRAERITDVTPAILAVLEEEG